MPASVTPTSSRPRNDETLPTSDTVADLTPGVLARYDTQGPRYTSYPTALEFHEGFTAENYDRHLQRADQAFDQPLSIYVHLPFCRERCLFCGCNVVVTPHLERARPYLKLLVRELDMLAERLPRRRTFCQLHLGGGTPTYFPPADLDAFLSRLFGVFSPTPGAELAVEVDPRVTEAGHLETLAWHGFNRLSVGVQDLEPEVQSAIGRIQSLEQTRSVVDTARELGFRGINVDLIYGLPRQTRESFGRTLDGVLELRPDRLAIYSFAFVPWLKAQQNRLDESALPAGEDKFALLVLARQRLLDAGYTSIGIDHFALPDDELARAHNDGTLRRNFQGYTVQPASTVIGLGTSAIGDVAGAYVQNHKKLSTYEAALDEGRLPIARGFARSTDDDCRRSVIQELMCNGRVDMPAIGQQFGVDFESYFAEDLRRLRAPENQALVEIDRDTIQATPVGRLFVRNLALCFDRYWRERHEGKTTKSFSRTL